jgi:hypothetical protein
MTSFRRALAVAAVLALTPVATWAASPDTGLRAQIFAAFARIKSYKLTVLGQVRSLGVWVSPNRYQMTTQFEGKAIKTIIIGKNYWTYNKGRWEQAGEASSNLEVDIAGLIRNAKATKTPFVPLPDQNQDGKRVGAFSYAFKNGTDETCNYDLSTYRVTRCKADELTLLYSGYNDPANAVAPPR